MKKTLTDLAFVESEGMEMAVEFIRWRRLIDEVEPQPDHPSKKLYNNEAGRMGQLIYCDLLGTVEGTGAWKRLTEDAQLRRIVLATMASGLAYFRSKGDEGDLPTWTDDRVNALLDDQCSTGIKH